MASKLFQTKSPDLLIRESEMPERKMKRSLTALDLTLPRHRRDHRHRHFCTDWHGRGGGTTRSRLFDLEDADPEYRALVDHAFRSGPGTGRRGAGGCDLIHCGRDCLRFRRALLRRARFHDPRFRIGLHLFLRHTRRTHRLDHRLGSHSRIRRRQHGGGRELVRLFCQVMREFVRAPIPSLGRDRS